MIINYFLAYNIIDVIVNYFSHKKVHYFLCFLAIVVDFPALLIFLVLFEAPLLTVIFFGNNEKFTHFFY